MSESDAACAAENASSASNASNANLAQAAEEQVPLPLPLREELPVGYEGDLADLLKGTSHSFCWAQDAEDDEEEAAIWSGRALEFDRPCRDAEPFMPPTSESTTKFWVDLFDKGSLDTRDDADRKAAIKDIVRLVNKMLALVAKWKEWGRWANANIDQGVDASQKLYAVADKLRDMLISANSTLSQLRKAEKQLGDRIAEEQTLCQKVGELLNTFEEQVSGLDHGGGVPNAEEDGVPDAQKNRPMLSAEQLQAILNTVSGLKDCDATKAKLTEAARLASEREGCRKELAMEKKRNVESFAVQEATMAGCLEGMTATASEVPNPKYAAQFGWSHKGKFVPNPLHPFWKGQNFAMWLQKTNSLHLPGYFYDAHKLEPGAPGSLKHPLGVIDDRSYFAGIRHRLQNTRANYDDMAWTPLPDDCHDLLDINWK